MFYREEDGKVQAGEGGTFGNNQEGRAAEQEE